MLDLGIQGRRAIVCGSSRGLGRACAEALARAGAVVVVNGIDADRVARAAAEIAAATGGQTTAVAADVTTREGQERLFAAEPSPDILVRVRGGITESSLIAVFGGEDGNRLTVPWWALVGRQRDRC
jgi:3-oxoacyl-[acyl-carrier protein] reductase